MADFPAATRDDWRALVSAVLARSGTSDAHGDPEQALSSTTYDDITVRPLYTADDAPVLPGVPGRPAFTRGPTPRADGWDVRVRHARGDVKALNAAVLEDLERGATSLWLQVPAGDLAGVLDGVYLDLAPVVLDAGADVLAAADALQALGDVIGSLGADPIGNRARTGGDADLTVLATLAGRARPGLCLATVDATVYHDAGASDAQELGIATAVGVAYLRALTDTGLSVDAALDALEFRFAVTAEQFPSIAKLRAARRVWDRIAVLCDASDDRRGQRQHAVTSAAMMTRRDPWVNMLRTTIGCFAAAVGGADAVTVAPFDSALGVPDGFARRVARNTHAVLHDESSLARVLDAAGGSWFVESLTEQLAEAAWTVFTDIERHGGVLTRLDDGTLGTFLAATQAKRAEDIAHRRVPITGVSEFAFVGEEPVTRPSSPEIPEGMLPRIRYAEGYESLRDRADAAAERPVVHVVPMGATANSPRVAFVQNLFNAGGFRTEVTTLDDFPGGVACLSGADRQYADEGPLYVRDLRAKGATLVWIAGKDDIGDGNVFTGCDALDVLQRTFEAVSS